MQRLADLDRNDLENRRVFIRVDFNVPLADGRVTNNARIVNALPTIEHAVNHGSKVVLASHLGRPKGEAKPELSLVPVADELGRLLGKNVATAPDCVGTQVQALAENMTGGDILLLENLRFHAEEEKNDAAFARQLAAGVDVYVNDAFGTAHRAHASTVGIVDQVNLAACGMLMEREITALGGLLTDAASPYVAIVGGAKVSDKILLLENLMNRVDAILIGGAMAYTLLKAQGSKVGASRVEEDKLELATKLLATAEQKGVAIELPNDHTAAAEFAETAEPVSVEATDIPDGLMGLDIGTGTRERFGARIAAAKTILWNGPMGVFEWDAFSAGTMFIAHAVADSKARAVVGGGDSVAALAKSGRSDDVFHVSTGGGASLEFLEGKTLPGIAALQTKAAKE